MRRRGTSSLLGLLVAMVLAGCGASAANPVSAPTSLPSPALTPPPSTPSPTAARNKRAKGARPDRPSLTSGPSDGSVYTVVRAGSLLVAGTEGRGVLASDGAERAWISMNDGLPQDASVVSIAVAPGDESLVALVSGQVYKARAQRPLSWSRFGRPLPRGSNPQSITYWPAAHAVLVGDGSGAVYASAGGKESWRSSDIGLPVNRSAITSLHAADGILYAGLSGGLAASSDGATWHMEAGLAGHTVDDLVPLPGGGLAVALDHDGLAVRSRSTAAWTLYPLAALGLPASGRVLSVTYDQTRRLLFLGTLALGVMAMHGPAPPAVAVPGIPPDDPVNDLMPTANGLLAATNSGLIRVTIGASQR